MENNDATKSSDNDSWLTVSDWFSFLISESNKGMSHSYAFGALIVASVAIVASITVAIEIDEVWTAVVFYIVVLLVLAFIFWLSRVMLSGILTKRAAVAEMILNRIISGDLKTEQAIRLEWQAECGNKEQVENKDNIANNGRP